MTSSMRFYGRKLVSIWSSFVHSSVTMAFLCWGWTDTFPTLLLMPSQVFPVLRWHNLSYGNWNWNHGMLDLCLRPTFCPNQKTDEATEFLLYLTIRSVECARSKDYSSNSSIDWVVSEGLHELGGTPPDHLYSEDLRLLGIILRDFVWHHYLIFYQDWWLSYASFLSDSLKSCQIDEPLASDRAFSNLQRGRSRGALHLFGVVCQMQIGILSTTVSPAYQETHCCASNCFFLTSFCTFEYLTLPFVGGGDCVLLHHHAEWCGWDHSSCSTNLIPLSFDSVLVWNLWLSAPSRFCPNYWACSLLANCREPVSH